MFERCLYFNANALARRLNAKWDAAFAPLNLAPSHGYLLRLVLEKPGLSQQSIADELHLEKSTIARFVSKLEDRGLLERRPAQGSLRDNAIFPTDDAIKLKRPLQQLGDDLYADMTDAIGARNLKALVAALREAAAKT